jgi:hypothetical protein
MPQAPLGLGSRQGSLTRACKRSTRTAFLSRPIESDWPYLQIDATCVRAGQSGRIVSLAVTASTAADGFSAQTGAARPRRAELIIFGRSRGYQGRRRRALDATWQRCRVHFPCNVLIHAVARFAFHPAQAVRRTAGSCYGTRTSWRSPALAPTSSARPSTAASEGRNLRIRPTTSIDSNKMGITCLLQVLLSDSSSAAARELCPLALEPGRALRAQAAGAEADHW